MKTTVIIIAFAVAVIASFSFITINKKPVSKESTIAVQKPSEPMTGFILEDEQQF